MLIVVDNFYNNVDEVREYALSKDFHVSGNYPGLRTECEPDYSRDYLKGYLEEHVVRRPITSFGDGYNTAFQYTTEGMQTWMHRDSTDWAGVCYLTPNAPVESGTGIYRHKETGLYEWSGQDPDFNEIKTNEDDWELITFVGNVYNRLVLYNGYAYHRSVLPGFGTDKFTGRLFQTFFFNT